MLVLYSTLTKSEKGTLKIIKHLFAQGFTLIVVT